MPPSTLPLVYACSGCSNVAQLANNLAVRLDRSGVAEMSCIAGVGGNVKHLVRIAKSGRRFWIDDGCVWQLIGQDGLRHGQAATFPISDCLI